jgi:anti-sigma regulatory factor (Ser/Thr protein kinase)
VPSKTLRDSKRLAESAITEAPNGRGSAAFRHEALLYSGRSDGFLEGTVPFLRDGARAGDAMLVVIDAEKIERVRNALGPDAQAVDFADMREVGSNPARIIPAWREFVDANPGRRLRGVGEPIWAQRSAAELVECQRHEALVNLAFADAAGFTLLCPYDVDALDPAVVEKAHHSHPVLVQDGADRPSASYLDIDAIAAPFAEPLPEPPAGAHALAFTTGTLGAVRELAAALATAVGVSAQRAGDFVLAVNELATNSVVHGGGQGVLRIWEGGGALICEIADGGAITEPLAGRRRPPDGRVGGHGLWLVNQLCDLVQIRSFADGGVVRLHMRR